MKRPLTYFAFSIILLLPACEKAFMDEDPGANPKDVFHQLWQDVDQKYAFFEYKQVDWDSVRRIYEPKINENLSDRQLFDTLAKMLNTLKDGHVNLISDFDQSRYWDWYLDYPQNFDFTLLERHYLNENYRISDNFTIYYRKFDTLGTSIGYMYVPSFNGSSSVLDEILKTFKSCDGVIVDVRDNGGGSAQLAETLAGKFTKKERQYAQWQYKNGPEHDDFTPLRNRYIKPEGDRQFIKPTAVLMNRSSFSATNDFILAMKTIPHATLIGDRSGGGGGIPHKNQLPNGWTYRLSKTITWSKKMNNVENGIEPDISIDMGPPDKRGKTDAILERGIRYISNQ